MMFALFKESIIKNSTFEKRVKHMNSSLKTKEFDQHEFKNMAFFSPHGGK